MVVTYLQLSFIEKALRENPSAFVMAAVYMLFADEQKPSPKNTIKKQTAAITHLYSNFRFKISPSYQKVL